MSRRIEPASEHEPPAVWRQARNIDLAAIAGIAEAIHPHLPEGPAIFAERLQLFPQGCFVLAPNGIVAGYGISYPWMLHDIPPLGTLLEGLPLSSECLFVHDVAIVPAARGNGSAGKLLQILTAVARSHHLPFLALVSVYGTDVLWSRFGFRAQSGSRVFDKLDSYGPTARYMMAAV